MKSVLHSCCSTKQGFLTLTASQQFFANRGGTFLALRWNSSPIMNFGLGMSYIVHSKKSVIIGLFEQS